MAILHKHIKCKILKLIWTELKDVKIFPEKNSSLNWIGKENQFLSYPNYILTQIWGTCKCHFLQYYGVPSSNIKWLASWFTGSLHNKCKAILM